MSKLTLVRPKDTSSRRWPSPPDTTSVQSLFLSIDTMIQLPSGFLLRRSLKSICKPFLRHSGMGKKKLPFLMGILKTMTIIIV